MSLRDPRPFADAEEVLRRLLVADLDGGVIVVSATGPELNPPVVKVRRIGGENDYITDYATMLVSSFCATRPESNVLAAQVQVTILNAVCRAILMGDGTTALIDNAVVVTADHPELYENPDVRQVSATYELRMRRPWPPA